jgi:hypothetical protein
MNVRVVEERSGNPPALRALAAVGVDLRRHRVVD